MIHVRSLLASLAVALALTACWGVSSASALQSVGGGLYFQSLQPFGWSLGSLSIADANNLWMTAYNGPGIVLLHSPDAGMSWQHLDLGLDQDIQLNSLTFLDPEHARALASWYDHGNSSYQIALLITDDGGATWSLQPIPSDGFLDYGATFVSTDIAFVTGREYSASTNRWHTMLLSTTDAGASWKRIPVACRYPYDLTAIDARHLWLRDADTACIWTSANAGVSWTKHSLPLKGEGSTVYYVDTLQALSSKVAWIQVTRRARPHNIVMRTIDGGKSWRLITHLERYADGRLTAISTDEAWLAVSVDSVRPQQPAYYKHTTDGGLTWTRTYVGPGVGGLTRCPDGSLFALGDGLSRSTDGGSTWLRLIGGRFGYWLNDVTASPAGELWAVGWTTPDSPGIYGDYDGDQGLLFRCSDGVSWRQQEIPDGSMLCGIDFSDSQVGWAVGWNGRVLRTTDGGGSWTPCPARSALGLHAVEAIDANRAVAIAWDEGSNSDSVIVRTTNGGATWVESPRPASDTLKAICSLGPGHLLVVGSRYGPKQGLLLESTDAGATWNERLIDYSRTLRDVTFADSQHGWILASDGPSPVGGGGSLVLRTSDGGANWQVGDLGTMSATSFAAIAFADDQHGWLFGDKELQTTDGGANWSDTGAVMPSSALGLFWDEPVVRAAVVSNGNLWAVGADQLILSTLDTTADTAPPLSGDDGDRRWHNAAVTTHISANDPAGTGVATTEYRVDSGAWQPLVDGAVTIDAPSSHAGDGTHEILYRSTDNAGNVEFPELCVVHIDTRRPSTKVGAPVTVRRGEVANLRYRVTDAKPNGGSANVTIKIRRRGGATVKTLRLGAKAVNAWLSAKYRCRLIPGAYSFTVHATDTAGNSQSTIGRGRLLVR